MEARDFFDRFGFVPFSSDLEKFNASSAGYRWLKVPNEHAVAAQAYTDQVASTEALFPHVANTAVAVDSTRHDAQGPAQAVGASTSPPEPPLSRAGTEPKEEASKETISAPPVAPRAYLLPPDGRSKDWLAAHNLKGDSFRYPSKMHHESTVPCFSSSWSGKRCPKSCDYAHETVTYERMWDFTQANHPEASRQALDSAEPEETYHKAGTGNIPCHVWALEGYCGFLKCPHAHRATAVLSQLRRHFAWRYGHPHRGVPASTRHASTSAVSSETSGPSTAMARLKTAEEIAEVPHVNCQERQDIPERAQDNVNNYAPQRTQIIDPSEESRPNDPRVTPVPLATHELQQSTPWQMEGSEKRRVSEPHTKPVTSASDTALIDPARPEGHSGQSQTSASSTQHRVRSTVRPQKRQHTPEQDASDTKRQASMTKPEESGPVEKPSPAKDPRIRPAPVAGERRGRAVTFIGRMGKRTTQQ